MARRAEPEAGQGRHRAGATGRVPKRSRRILGWCLGVAQCLTWLVTGFAIVTLGAVVLVPRVLGWTALSVTSASMTPAYPVGSQVIIAPANPAHPANPSNPAVRSAGDEASGHYEIGDVITYAAARPGADLVTHRVVAVVRGADGRHRYLTRGDANPSNDRQLVDPAMVRGEVRYVVPYMGHVAGLFSESVKNALVSGLVVVLLGYAGWRVGRRRRLSRLPVRRPVRS